MCNMYLRLREARTFGKFVAIIFPMVFGVGVPTHRNQSEWHLRVYGAPAKQLNLMRSAKSFIV